MRSATMDRLVDPACPPELREKIFGEIITGIAGQGILPGERLAEMVARRCPQVFEIARAGGFEVKLELRRNTHEALCRGEVFVRIKRRTAH